MPALREFLAPDAAQDDQPPDRAAHVPVLHRSRDDAWSRAASRAVVVRAQLPERAGVAVRRVDRPRRLPGAVRRVGGGRPERVPAAGPQERAHDRGLRVLAAIGLVVVGPLAIEVLLGGGAFDAEDVRVTAAVLAAFALAVPFDALGTCPRAACTRPTTRCCRSWRRSPGSRSRSWSPSRSWNRPASSRSRSGSRPGRRSASVLQGRSLLARRMRGDAAPPKPGTAAAG